MKLPDRYYGLSCTDRNIAIKAQPLEIIHMTFPGMLLDIHSISRPLSAKLL